MEVRTRPLEDSQHATSHQESQTPLRTVLHLQSPNHVRWKASSHEVHNRIPDYAVRQFGESRGSHLIGHTY